ncbi:hypothetical protein K474DRAFT_1764451 [Panus rudis PR-1116 ss-1]|nr:hypothetical protein K474DRAFT_1764451 [Panus rudis PR-1116 ss-1]
MMAWPLSLLSPSCSATHADVNSQGEGLETPRDRPDIVESSLAALLRHFEHPDVPIPPSSRIGDPKMKQRIGEPINLKKLFKFGVFAATKSEFLPSTLLSYTLRGPPKKSWGLQMTLLSCIMRDVGYHSHLADITTIRLLMGIGGLVPVPSDALVTPVTFYVRRRELRGILADFDSAEDGTRELAGEWVVGNRTYYRLQREWRALKRQQAKSPADLDDRKQACNQKERVILYLHGGAYYTSSPATHRLITIPLSKALDARLFALDYRLAPETRFPGPLHDAVSAYLRMTDDLHISPENIIVAGDSAGGGLSIALMMYLRDNGYPLPGAAILMSPWVDLTMSCDSWESNAQYDIVPMPQPGDHLNPIACYLGEHMEKYLTHPYASPLFGNFKGLPPMLIQAGDCEVLRDEITLLAHKATLAGVKVRHELYEDAVHVFQTIPFLDAAHRAFLSAREFVRDLQASMKADRLAGSTEQRLEEEINTKEARIVRGDGTECDAGPEPVLTPGEEDSGSQKGTESSEDEPSWFTPYPSPPPEAVAAGAAGPSDSARKYQTVSSSTTSHYRRHSITTTTTTSPPVPSRNPISIRRRTSTSHLAASSSSQRRAANISMTSSTATAPRPTIRRSHMSHPDISSLVQEYAASGPANRTLAYKPDGPPTRRKLSLSLAPASTSITSSSATAAKN